jgi:ParB/RepB/Spo0J family partition protein
MSELAALEAAGGAGTPVVLGGDPTAHATASAPPHVDRDAGAKASDRPEGPYQLIPIFLIQPARDNVRRDRGQLGELTASIKRKGVLEPLLVDARGDHFRIIAGERRWAAAKLAGLTAVPCIVRKGVDDYERLEDMLVENLQRRDLQPIEEAQAFDRMQTELGYSQRDIAQAIGKSQSYVSKRLLLLTLPAKVRREVAAGKLPMNEALGYQSAGPVDLFAADEDLQRAWLELRQNAIDTSDRVLLQLLGRFAKAFQVYKASLEAAASKRAWGGSSSRDR